MVTPRFCHSEFRFNLENNFIQKCILTNYCNMHNIILQKTQLSIREFYSAEPRFLFIQIRGQTSQKCCLYTLFLTINNGSAYCQNKTRLDLFWGLREICLEDLLEKKLSFSPELKMAEYKIIEIVSIDLGEWSLLLSLCSSEATTSAHERSPD